MNGINLAYEYILKLEMFYESEIIDIRKKYNQLTTEYNETCKYNLDMTNSKRSFYNNYGITKEDYERYSKELQIRQYKTYLELKELIKECKDQNDGHNYISCTIGLEKELIRFNTAYVDVKETLERLTK